MHGRINSTSTWLLAGGLAVCIGFLVHQYLLLKDLRDQLREQRVHISQLERAINVEKNISISFTRASLNSLHPGLYSLKTNTAYGEDMHEVSEYEITHLTADVGVDTSQVRLHIGIAMSGLVPIGTYFDYDNDGRIDGEMATKFMRDIPIVGSQLAKTFNPDVAQNLYTIFLSESDDSDYRSYTEMSDDAGMVAKQMWSFVIDKSEKISAYIEAKLKFD